MADKYNLDDRGFSWFFYGTMLEVFCFFKRLEVLTEMQCNCQIVIVFCSVSPEGSVERFFWSRLVEDSTVG